MTNLYVKLFERGVRTIDSMPPTVMVPVATALIIKKELLYSEVPTGYKTKVKAELKAAGYDENGDLPTETTVE